MAFLARRFLRLFKWIDCFNAAQAQFLLASTGPAVSQQTSSSEKPPKTAATVKQPEVDSTKALLGGLKFSLLGIYLFMEMFVIVSQLDPFAPFNREHPRWERYTLGILPTTGNDEVCWASVQVVSSI